MLAKELGVTEGIHLYVTVEEGKTLCLYDEKRFEQAAEELRQSDWDVEELLEYERLKYSLSRRVELDKAGRIRLPDDLRAMTGVGSDVVLLGVGDHLEIHDRPTWEARLDTAAKANALFLNPRRFMNRKRGNAKDNGDG